mgnify:FL=1
MNQRSTPRTDALEWAREALAYYQNHPTPWNEPLAYLARTLERENARLLAALEEVRLIADENLMGLTNQRIQNVIRAALARVRT